MLGVKRKTEPVCIPIVVVGDDEHPPIQLLCQGDDFSISKVGSVAESGRESGGRQSGGDAKIRTLAGFRGLAGIAEAVPQQLQHSYETAQHYANRLSMIKERTFLAK